MLCRISSFFCFCGARIFSFGFSGLGFFPGAGLATAAFAAALLPSTAALGRDAPRLAGSAGFDLG